MRAALLLLALSLLTGCASIVDGNKYPIAIQSKPSGADYQILNEDGDTIHHGTTPDSVTLTSNDGAFDGEVYTLKFQKEGYENGQVMLESGTNGWFIANILLGGVIGMTVDMISGAAYDLPDRAVATLKPTVQPVAAAPTAQHGSAPSPLSQPQWKEQQLQQLQQQQGLSYEEYQRRYKAITGQQ